MPSADGSFPPLPRRSPPATEIPPSCPTGLLPCRSPPTPSAACLGLPVAPPPPCAPLTHLPPPPPSSSQARGWLVGTASACCASCHPRLAAEAGPARPAGGGRARSSSSSTAARLPCPALPCPGPRLVALPAPPASQPASMALVAPAAVSSSSEGPLVLLDGASEVPWTQFFTTLHWIQAVMAALSVIGSSSMIGYAVFQNTARSPEVRPLFYLSLSDLFLGMSWLTGALLYRKETTQPANQDVACYNVQAAGEIFYLASFLYTINYTWHLYTDLKVKYYQHIYSQSPQTLSYTNHIGRIAIVLSSVIPVCLMMPVFSLGNCYGCYRNFTLEHGCLLMHTEIDSVISRQDPACSRLYFYGIGVFLVVFLSSFVAILVLLIQARALYKRFVSATGYVGDQQWAMMKLVEQGVILYPVAFFCCWGPAFLLGIVKLTPLKINTLYMALWALEALMASSQGLLHCAVYGRTQYMFRCLKRKACRDVDTQTPLLRSQKRFYASTLPAAATSTSTVL
ncbi:transmembrane protein 116 [Hemicordylus capensis]|uniref:transmembrane protein 116 n=1 Tax=Hemicordylus capensis TaxID=884348 RepID=UPI0023028D56|nr:transmembrane protein 116 [Hemicordylus capensis]